LPVETPVRAGKQIRLVQLWLDEADLGQGYGSSDPVGSLPTGVSGLYSIEMSPPKQAALAITCFIMLIIVVAVVVAVALV
jgi:hypothetical protein